MKLCISHNAFGIGSATIEIKGVNYGSDAENRKLNDEEKNAIRHRMKHIFQRLQIIIYVHSRKIFSKKILQNKTSETAKVSKIQIHDSFLFASSTTHQKKENRQKRRNFESLHPSNAKIFRKKTYITLNKHIK